MTRRLVLALTGFVMICTSVVWATGSWEVVRPWVEPLAGILLVLIGFAVTLLWLARHRTGTHAVVTSPKSRSDKAEMVERARDSLTQLVGGDVLFKVKRGDRTGPVLIEVSYPNKFRDDSDEQRAIFMDRLSVKLPGRWKATNWDTTRNVVIVERRPEMPKVVVHPVPDEKAALDTWRIPIGIDEHSDTAIWDLSIAPHALVVGTTGGGKTNTISGIIIEALLRGFEVVVIDGKGTSLAGFRSVPGVVKTGLGDPAEMAEAMEWAEATMYERYRQVREEGAEPEDFAPLLVVLDEAATFALLVAKWWKATRKTTDPREAAALDAWHALARLGREGHVHLIVGIQQAAASFFGGTESRDQLPARIACGPLTEQGARMTFGRSDIGRDVPDEPKGRGTVDLGHGPVEVQIYRTPTPKPNGSYRPADAALLSALLPARETSDSISDVSHGTEKDEGGDEEGAAA